MGTRANRGKVLIMAERTVEKGSDEWMAFMDLWDIYKKNGTPEDGEKNWHDLVWKYANDFMEKYKNIPQYPIFRNMVVGMIEGIDEMVYLQNEGK